jgi:hypothetical protein
MTSAVRDLDASITSGRTHCGPDRSPPAEPAATAVPAPPAG